MQKGGECLPFSFRHHVYGGLTPRSRKRRARWIAPNVFLSPEKPRCRRIKASGRGESAKRFRRMLPWDMLDAFRKPTVWRGTLQPLCRCKCGSDINQPFYGSGSTTCFPLSKEMLRCVMYGRYCWCRCWRVVRRWSWPSGPVA